MDTLQSFFGTWDEEGYVAVFQVYADESGKFKDTDFVTFGSIVFEQSAASSFSQRWNGTLPSGISFVSMKEAMHCQGQFSGWKDRREKERDEMLEALAKLAWDRCGFLNNSTLTSQEFKEKPDSEKRRLKGDIVFACFEALVKGINDWAVTTNRKKHKFHLIYDMSEEYSEKSLSLFIRMRRMDSTLSARFLSISFADDKHFPPLQAADMISYTDRAIRTGDNRPIVKRLHEIFSQGEAFYRRDLVIAVGEGIGTGVLELPLS